MAGVREPTGQELFPKDAEKAAIYDVAQRLMSAAVRGEIVALEANWDLKGGGGLMTALGSDPGTHLQNLGALINQILVEIGAIDLDEEEEDEGPTNAPS